MTKLSSKDATFWNSTARKYAARPISNDAVYQQKLDMTRRYFTPESEVLEMGCGTGSTALLHAPYVKHIRAIDFSSEMIAIAKEKAAEQGVKNVTFDVGTYEDTELPPNHYDVVLALNVLHLVPDIPGALRNTYDTVKPGGMFISSTACLQGWLRGIVPLVRAGRLFGKMPYVKTVTRKDISRMIEDAGFETVEAWHPEKTVGMFIIAQKPA